MTSREKRTLTSGNPNNPPGKMTVGALRRYLQDLDAAKCPDSAIPDVRVTIGGQIRRLDTTWEVRGA